MHSCCRCELSCKHLNLPKMVRFCLLALLASVLVVMDSLAIPWSPWRISTAPH